MLSRHTWVGQKKKPVSSIAGARSVRFQDCGTLGQFLSDTGAILIAAVALPVTISFKHTRLLAYI